MKKLFIGFLLAALMPLSACGQMRWEEGTHYRVISDQATAKPEVIEFFSFWCPACNAFEPIVQDMKTRLGDDVKLTKVHVNFMQFASQEVQDDVTRAMLVGRTLKDETRLNGAIFNYIHRQRGAITNLIDVRNIFLVNGIEGEEFDKMVSGFSVNSLVRKNNKTIDDYRQHLNGVPNFIVNGKYQATFTRDMTPDDMVNLIVWLSQQK